MSSNDEDTTSKQANSPAEYNSTGNFTIWISSVTGHKWEQSVTLCETVDSLKVTGPFINLKVLQFKPLPTVNQGQRKDINCHNIPEL